MFDPAVFTSATDTLRAIQMAVAHGAFWYVCGDVPADRALALAARFHERYQLGITVGQRDHARREGRATFRLFMWPQQSGLGFHWWLLRTDGRHPLLSMERWLDARSTRIAWPWWYELVQLPVDPVHRQKYKRRGGGFRIGSVTWTWRISREMLERLKASIRHWAQCTDGRLSQLIRTLQLCPGLRGVRQDVYLLYRYITSQCKKRNKPAPAIPATIRWVSGWKSHCVPLSALVQRAASGQRFWFDGPDDLDFPNSNDADTPKKPEPEN